MLRLLVICKYFILSIHRHIIWKIKKEREIRIIEGIEDKEIEKIRENKVKEKEWRGVDISS